MSEFVFHLVYVVNIRIQFTQWLKGPGAVHADSLTLIDI